MIPAAVLLGNLVESLRLVASDIEDQIKALPSFVHLPDEIALTYDDEFSQADQIHQAGLINDSIMEKLKALESLFDHMSDNKELWTHQALANSPEWAEPRRMARDILHDLDQGWNRKLHSPP